MTSWRLLNFERHGYLPMTTLFVATVRQKALNFDGQCYFVAAGNEGRRLFEAYAYGREIFSVETDYDLHINRLYYNPRALNANDAAFHFKMPNLVTPVWYPRIRYRAILGGIKLYRLDQQFSLSINARVGFMTHEVQLLVTAFEYMLTEYHRETMDK